MGILSRVAALTFLFCFPLKFRSTSNGKNLLLQEQILPFKSRSPLEGV